VRGARGRERKGLICPVAVASCRAIVRRMAAGGERGLGGRATRNAKCDMVDGTLGLGSETSI
jgi:hypothetical protein